MLALVAIHVTSSGDAPWFRHTVTSYGTASYRLLGAPSPMGFVSRGDKGLARDKLLKFKT